MRRTFAIFVAFIAWFAVVVQFVLMLQNRVASVSETIIRYFSFFTILTNTIAALYFTGQSLKLARTYKTGILTATTVYIFMVGIVYQILLRHIWQPTGLQLAVDELLHTLNPLLVILYWYLYEKKSLIKYSQIKVWLVYPLAYLAFIIIRGSFSGFYPYPFVNISEIGIIKTLVNSILLALFFTLMSFIFIAIGKKT